MWMVSVKWRHCICHAGQRMFNNGRVRTWLGWSYSRRAKKMASNLEQAMSTFYPQMILKTCNLLKGKCMANCLSPSSAKSLQLCLQLFAMALPSTRGNGSRTLPPSMFLELLSRAKTEPSNRGCGQFYRKLSRVGSKATSKTSIFTLLCNNWKRKRYPRQQRLRWVLRYSHLIKMDIIKVVRILSKLQHKT